MKSRNFNGKFFTDAYIQNLTLKEKLVYIYYLFNDRVNWLGTYEVTDKTVLFEVGDGLTNDSLQTIKEKFVEDEKMFFLREWVVLKNSEKYDPHLNNKQLMSSALKQFEQLPEDVKSVFLSFKPKYVFEAYMKAFAEKDYEIDLDSLSVAYKQLTSKREVDEVKVKVKVKVKDKVKEEKEKIKNKKEKEESDPRIVEILQHFNKTFDRNYTSTRAWEDNASFWLEEYPVEKIKQAITNWKNNGWWVKRGEENLQLLFRTTNTNGKCDYIDELLNSKKKGLVINA